MKNKTIKTTRNSLKKMLPAFALLVFANTGSAVVADFSDVDLSIPPAQSYSGGGFYYNGSDGAGGYVSGGAYFVNNYNASWGSWDSWAYSSTYDTTTAGFGNQYSAYIPDGGTSLGYGDSVYGVYYQPFGGDTGSIQLGAGMTEPLSMRITNTTYAALSMLNDDSFAKKFGGTSGDDEDWFKLDITGYDSIGNTTGAVEFYLADYRFADNSQDYIVDSWALVDLSPLGDQVSKLGFALSSSDVGSYGMNTPAYFAMDNLEAVPEPSTYALIFGVVVLGLAYLRRGKRG